jgi:hypothetical protein
MFVHTVFTVTSAAFWFLLIWIDGFRRVKSKEDMLDVL